MLNQPQILQGVGQLANHCQRNTVYFNYTFTNPRFMKGVIQIYGGLLGENELKGEYENVEGYSVSGEEIE